MYFCEQLKFSNGWDSEAEGPSDSGTVLGQELSGREARAEWPTSLGVDRLPGEEPHELAQLLSQCLS